MNKKYKNQSEFETLRKEVFYTKPEDFVKAISIAPTYDLALNRSKILPIKPPYVTSILIDFIYNGYCAKINLEALRSYMISQGDIKEDEIDSAFYALVYMKIVYFL